MTTANTARVAMRLITLGRRSRQKASRRRARPLSFHVKRRWKREMIAPSNSGPRPVLIVVGENTFQTIDSQILVAIKREIP
jgi:hypothetical protein